jgi:Fe(3+) dicitrate transport protein
VPEPDLEVRIVGNRADAIQRVPGSGTVIGAKEIDRAQPVNTAEMLRRVPGVQVREEFSGGSRLDLSIRGLESGRSRRVLMLEDGVPLALNPYSEPDMNYAPAIERYRAIEVVKGSGNILFGPQTLAGTINFVTRSPPDRPTFIADVDGGTYGYLRTLASYGDSVGNARFFVQVLNRRGDGFREQAFESTDALGKVVFPTGENGEAVVRLSWRQDDAVSEDVGLTSRMYRENPRQPTLAPHDHLLFDRYDVAVIHEQRFSSQTKLKTLVYAYSQPRIWRRQDWDRGAVPGITYERVVGDATTPREGVFFRYSNAVLDRDYGVVGLEPRAEHRARTGSVEHTFDFGGRVLRETAHYDQREGGYPDTYAGSSDFEERHTGTAFAVYLQDRIAFTPKLLVTPGIRFEHLELDRVVLRQAVSGVVQDAYNEGTQGVSGVVPGIGTTYGSKEATLFAGVHVGFAPPRVTSAISPRGLPADVHAEQSINYELGTRLAPTSWLRAEGTGFLSNFNNQVIVNTTPGVDANLTDAGATNIFGAETSIALAIDRLLELPLTTELGVRYTFSRATFRYGPNAGNLLPYAPEHSANANLDLEHRSGLGGQIAYTFVSRQFTDAANVVPEDVTGSVGVLDAYSIVDATAHYRYRPWNLTFRLTAKNLLDADYVLARRPNGIFPGGFRQVILGVRWEWEGRPRE